MKRLGSIILTSLLALGPAFGQQSVEEILLLVAQNNTSLQAAVLRTEADKQEARLEAALDDPEVGFDYLWGKPGSMGVRRDVNVSQSFDLAQLFGQKRRLARSQQELLDLTLEQQQAEVQMQALDLLIQLTYYNQALAAYDERIGQERQLATAYQRRLEAGDGNKLEANRARLALTQMEAEAERMRTEADLLRLDLQTMCGGTAIEYRGTDYLGFEQGMTRSLRQILTAQHAQQQEVSDAALASTRAQSLPSLTAGYMAELTDEEKWRGVTIGVSIPLWSNRRNLRRARLQQQSTRSEVADATLRLEQMATASQLRAERYQGIAQRMHEQLTQASPQPLLRKALDEGEISLFEYLIETADIFELKLKCMEAERDYQQARMQAAAFK